jgi:hypothetical protein
VKNLETATHLCARCSAELHGPRPSAWFREWALSYAAVRLREVTYHDWDWSEARYQAPDGQYSRNPSYVLEKMAEAEENECITCIEDPPDARRGECPNSRRPCGHHCNCSWIHDACCWCGWKEGEGDA